MLAFVSACGATEEEHQRFATAWRRIGMAQDARLEAPPIRGAPQSGRALARPPGPAMPPGEGPATVRVAVRNIPFAWWLLYSAWLRCRVGVGVEADDHQVSKPDREPVVERQMAHQSAEVQRRDQHFDCQGAVGACGDFAAGDGAVDGGAGYLEPSLEVPGAGLGDGRVALRTGQPFLWARGSMTTVRYGAASRPRSSGSAVCTTPPPASIATATG